MSSACGVPCWRCVCGVFCREHRLSDTPREGTEAGRRGNSEKNEVSFVRYMSPPPQEGAVSITSSERLLTSLSVLCVTKCPFSVCSDDSLSLPTSFPGTGEQSKLNPQTFSEPEILRHLTSSVSSALDEAASALNKIRSEAVPKGDLSSESNINSGSVQ